MRFQVLLGLALAAAGCRSRILLPPPPIDLQTEPSFALPPDASVHLSRGACYGRCPVYEVTISGDGTVEYQGVRHVRVKGFHSKRVAPSVVARLFADIIESGFLGWRDSYETPSTDLESARLSLTCASTHKTVDDYGASSRDRHAADAHVRDKLEALELRVDAVARSAAWVVCPGEEFGCPESE